MRLKTTTIMRHKMQHGACKVSGTILFLMAHLISCSTPGQPVVSGDGAEVISFRAIPFEIEDVKLAEGPFLRAARLNSELLLNYEPDRFLARFRIEAGLEPRAEQYHGWEDNTIAGHSLGHYLTAICQMYESTGNEEFKRRAIYITDELQQCQEADGDGYIGAFPRGKEILEEEVAKGIIRASGFDLNGIWVPFYTEHKVMSGLNQVYMTFGYQEALGVNTRFADWLSTVVSGLTDEQVQEMLNCEHGGINESLAELYGLTGNKQYLELSRTFQHRAIIDPITRGEDILAGKHSNTQIPKFVGLARRYELTGDEKDRTGAVNFWNMMVRHHTYVTGGNGNYEYLVEPDRLNDQLSDNTTESCNVYNMLKLSEHLFSWSADPEVMDFYERALLNHILSSQHPRTGRVIYNLSLDMGGFKVYQDPFDFTCCIGTGMENHSKYSRNIYYHNDRELFAVQFIASELTWKEKGIRVRLATGYPEDGHMTYTFEAEEPVTFDFNIRYPAWAGDGMEVRVNGTGLEIDQEPGSFVKIGRVWESGDRVEVNIPFSLREETMPDNQNRIAVLNGPLVMAADLGPVPDPRSTDPLYVPVLMTHNPDPDSWLTPVEGNDNRFRTVGVAYPEQVEMAPFYRTHDRHYSIYLDTYTGEEWEQHQVQVSMEMKRKRELDLKTIDLFRMGEMQPERDHQFREKDTWVEEYKSKKARTADRGGWFSFEMAVGDEDSVSLSVEYWGGYSGSKTFDILVENQVIATENITNKAPGKFIDVAYGIPGELVMGRDRVLVQFIPHDGHRAGPVFTVRTIRE
jgi:uncharacterized protein